VSKRVDDMRWPGQELESEPEAERLELDEEPEVEHADENDTPAPEPPASDEPDELPKLRGPGAGGEHAPGELDIPDDVNVLRGTPGGGRRAVVLIVARYNAEVTNALLESALAALDELGVSRETVTIVPVPGAFELPLAAMAFAKTRRYACVVALGCVIRGETPHFDFVAAEAASGLQLAALETGVPVSFGVLTLENAEQAEERYEKGAEAVRSALEMADLFSQLRASAVG